MRTARLLLVPATTETLRAELESREAFARALDAEVPASWPPELYGEDTVRWTLNWLEKNPEVREWGFYYVIEAPMAPNDRPRLAGAGGYKGPPDASGAVEIGYAVVSDRRRRGYAREAVAAWLARAFADPRVTHVVAHTLQELTPSIGVLRSSGFDFVGKGNDPHEPDAIRFELTRARYEAEASRPASREAPIPVRRASP